MEYWLACRIAAGNFPGEYAVSGQMADGTEFSLFATEEDVEIEGGPIKPGRASQGWIRVSVVERQGDLVLVRLPRRPIENGAFVTVKEQQLRPSRERQEA